MNKPFTVEEVALHSADDWYEDAKLRSSHVADVKSYYEGFLAGVKWHSEQSGWVKCSDRLPTKEDADEEDNVEFWDAKIKLVVSDLYYLISESDYTHWRKIVKPEN